MTPCESGSQIALRARAKALYQLCRRDTSQMLKVGVDEGSAEVWLDSATISLVKCAFGRK
jgi:hypothetical protein